MAFLISISSMTWKDNLSLNIARYKHSCGVLKAAYEKKIVVVAGGIDRFKKISNTVETLLVMEGGGGLMTLSDNNYWDYGPSLPMPLSDAASATTADQTGFFLFGGTSDNAATSVSIFKLGCSHAYDFQQGCTWTKIDHELHAPSAMGLAISMPSYPLGHRSYSNVRHCHQGEQS